MASFGHRGGTLTTISVPGTSAGRGRCAQRSQASTPRGRSREHTYTRAKPSRLHSDRGGEGSGGVGGSITPHPARYARHPLPWERAEVSRFFQRSPFLGDQPFPRGRGLEFLHPQRSPFWRTSSFPWGGGGAKRRVRGRSVQLKYQRLFSELLYSANAHPHPTRPRAAA